MFDKKFAQAIVVGVAAIAIAQSANSADKGSDLALISTPADITLVDVTNAAQKLLWRRLGDAAGKPLYTFDQDNGANKSTCVDACAKEFPPLIASPGAVAYDAWTLINREGNVKQWAYQGRPLYRYSGEDPAGEPAPSREIIKDDNDRAIYDFGSKLYSPKDGWKRAAYLPEKKIATPAGIALQSLAVANGYGFVIPNTGMVTYMLKTAPKNTNDWMPVYAPGAAQPVGDFSIVVREDGTQQWAYKNQLLYTFKGDYSPGDINGLVGQKDARVALAYQHFMPAGVKIDILALRGPILTTAKGLTLYNQSRQKLQYGGRETRGGYRFSYKDAKAVGTLGCVDECLKYFHPLAAPANAKSSGFWEVASRPDGSKQWAYRGSPLYTYVDDKEPGDIEGNNRHVIVYGDPEGKTDLTLTGGDIITGNYGNFGSGFYWHLVGLFN